MWALLNDSTLAGSRLLNSRSTLGFGVAVTSNYTPWFGVTTEGGGNFFSQDVGVTRPFDLQTWTLLVGPKFTFRSASPVLKPFGQVLLGLDYVNASVPRAGFPDSAWEFAIQPGGGVDIVVSEHVAVRLGLDGRILLDNGDHHTNQLRFTTGITFRSNFK